MKNLFRHLYLFVLLLLFSTIGHAQLYPVQLTSVFTSPYSVKISDYATSMDTKLQLFVNPTDVTMSQRQVRLKLYIQGNGLHVQSSDFIQGQRPIFINGGELQTLTNVDIAPLFRLENLQGISPQQYANGLPEGMYNFCFEMYDLVTNQKISQKSCTSLYLILNDPPILNTPQRNEQIASTEFPNILFTWTPRQRNATNVSYKFELKQLLDPTLDPQIAFQMSPVLYEETLFGTALLYNLSMPILTPGLRYAWRVKAISTTGLSENAIFKNDGYSEIYSFKYTAACAAPTFLLSETQSSKSVKITWEGVPEHTRYQVQYKKQGVRNAQWFSSNSLNKQSLITNLEPGLTYEFRVGSSCDPAEDGVQSFTYSGINTFTTAAQTNSVAAYNCGIVPQINIQNQKPLTNLIQSETFKAGDFPVTILELKGENSPYSGRGYIVVPYLADTKIAVEFNNIVINTDYQLISGVVETSYNPDWKNVTGSNQKTPVEEILETQGETDIIDNNDKIITGIENKPTLSEDGTDLETRSDKDIVTVPITNSDSSNLEDSNAKVDTPSENPIVNDSDHNKGNSEITNNSYFIEFKGKKYKDGEKIQIPYNRNYLGHNRFKMSELDKGVNVKYELAYQSENGVKLEKIGGNNYLKKMESKTEADFDFSFDSTLKYQLKSVADIDKKPSLSNEIILIVKPVKLNSLKAIDNSNKDNDKRVANATQTLYYVDKDPSSKDNKRTKFLIGLSIPTDEIGKQNIKWKFNEVNQLDYEGLDVLNNVYIYDYVKNFKVTSIVGGATESTKNVDIKWIDKHAVAWSFVPPGISQAINSTFKEVDGNLTKLDRFVKISKFLKLKVDKVKINGSKYNEEDTESRLYKKMEVGSVSGGFGVETPEKVIPIPALAMLSRAGIVDVGLYFKASFGVEVEGGVERYILAEQTKYINKKKAFFKIGPKGSITAGVKAELLVAKDQVIFDVRGGTEVSLKGEINYNFADKKLTGEIYFPPVIFFANIQIETKGFIEFELVDYQGSIEVTDKFTLYEYNKQF
ncbi:fibronectin type III domain-containing protein [Flavobacterium sp. N502540]|uniref:fibronectin type III domain-containing protein n=1 Tax=Flavobacterium sp. N502540 TaxID=2986838 RepID=UPI002225543A|nr:fibronectin type III domain-containing protein [Flavobacterium sp. N502540]